ncbi:bifunctional diaminohydroxyphosphoribosylaminopyrimidine deaminase/5-amino-6-(5-phosphoribosylamino)uracil reductase RibD, partial [Patescibacteria group bacterium]|nr:bifunctional diaminohydroxyphosphoribosylaminopyrimidine deaminase/5-amino-6-(5-phosphoribosylamino)uracil reductase RibD [Patescibacteria group bacterium]
MSFLQDKQIMEQVFGLAGNGQNMGHDPKVGAIVVKKGKIIAQGYHRTSGEDHAEVDAFKKVKNKAELKGAILYTNLEPCCIYRRTPSCVDQIIKYGLKEVVVSNQDPFPQVNGFGFKLLRKRGVKVRTGLMKLSGAQVNQRFFSWCQKQKLKKPQVNISTAASADGKIVDHTLAETHISSPADKRYKDSLRSQHDAILIGGETFLRDDPSLIIKD